jgi:hypothetical protein
MPKRGSASEAGIFNFVNLENNCPPYLVEACTPEKQAGNDSKKYKYFG